MRLLTKGLSTFKDSCRQLRELKWIVLLLLMIPSFSALAHRYDSWSNSNYRSAAQYHYHLPLEVFGRCNQPGDNLPCHIDLYPSWLSQREKDNGGRAEWYKIYDLPVPHLVNTQRGRRVGKMDYVTIRLERGNAPITIKFQIVFANLTYQPRYMQNPYTGGVKRFAASLRIWNTAPYNDYGACEITTENPSLWNNVSRPPLHRHLITSVIEHQMAFYGGEQAAQHPQCNRHLRESESSGLAIAALPY